MYYDQIGKYIGPFTVLSGHLTQADSVRLQVGPRLIATVLSPAGDFRLVVAGLQEPQQATFSYGGQRTPRSG